MRNRIYKLLLMVCTGHLLSSCGPPDVKLPSSLTTPCDYRKVNALSNACCPQGYDQMTLNGETYVCFKNGYMTCSDYTISQCSGI